jgi:hypothetical protein
MLALEEVYSLPIQKRYMTMMPVRRKRKTASKYSGMHLNGNACMHGCGNQHESFAVLVVILVDW